MENAVPPLDLKEPLVTLPQPTNTNPNISNKSLNLPSFSNNSVSTQSTISTLFKTLRPESNTNIEDRFGSSFVGLESVLGVTARASGGAALSYNPRLDCLLYAAGSTLVLWNFQRDTRLYLEGDGHASTISAIAVTSDGNHVASASFEGSGVGQEFTSHPTIVLWDVTGKRNAGGKYDEIYRSVRVSCSDPACGVVTSMKLAFSPGDGILASLAVCEPAIGSSNTSKGTLQLCLFDWNDDFRLLQRCTIQGDGEGNERSVHIFAPEHVMSANDNSNNPFSTATGAETGTGIRIQQPTFHETTREENDKREVGYLSWCSENRICVVYDSHVFALEFIPGGQGLSIVHVRNLHEKLSEKSQRSKKANKLKSRRMDSNGGTSSTICYDEGEEGRNPHAIVGAAVCVPYSLLLLLSRSGRLLVCETSTCSVVNSVPPPMDDKEPISTFTALSVDGEETTIGTSTGTLWSLSMRELKWRRPLPFQRRMRARLLGGGSSSTAKENTNENTTVQYQRGWPVVAAISLPISKSKRRNNNGKSIERIAAMYGDHSIAVFELGASSTPTINSTNQKGRRGSKSKKNNGKSNQTAKGGTVTNHAVGHFGAVRSSTWHPEKTSSVLITSSSDQSIGVWQLTPILDDLGAPESYSTTNRNSTGKLPDITTGTINNNESSTRSSEPRSVEAPTERRARLVRVLDVSSSISSDLPYSRCSRVTLDIANFGQIDDISGKSTSIEISALAYHPLGGRIACGDNHGMVRIYSTVSGRLLHMRDTTGGNHSNNTYDTTNGMNYVDMEGGIEGNEGEENHPDDVRTSRSISSISFSTTGRYVGVARRDGKTMVLDGWAEWCRGCILTTPCLDPFNGHAEGVISFVMRPSLPRHSTPRDPTPNSKNGERNSTAESVRGTCCVVALSSESIGLVTVVPVTAGRHHERRRNNGGNDGNDGNDGIANEDMRDSCDVGAVEWKRGFEPTRLLSEFKLDGALRACRIHPSNEYIVCLTSKGNILFVQY